MGQHPAVLLTMRRAQQHAARIRVPCVQHRKEAGRIPAWCAAGKSELLHPIGASYAASQPHALSATRTTSAGPKHPRRASLRGVLAALLRTLISLA